MSNQSMVGGVRTPLGFQNVRDGKEGKSRPHEKGGVLGTLAFISS